MSRGILVVIEGGDASGKATQTKALQAKLEASGRAVEVLDFPRYGDNQMGTLIRECLDGTRGDFLSVDSRVASTLYAVDRFESKVEIEAWLAAGKVVILDRYTSANLLHQGAKIADDAERAETIKWIYELEHTILGLPVPDRVFYLAVPAIVRAELFAGKGRDADAAEANVAHQEAVDERAPSIMGLYPGMREIACMDGDELKAVEEITAAIYAELRVIL